MLNVVFGAGALINNLYNGLFVLKIGLWSELASPFIVPVALFTVLGLVAAFVDRPVMRLFQCFLFIAVSTISLLMTPNGQFGIGFYVLGMALLFQYGFLKTHLIAKMVGLIGYIFVALAYFTLMNSTDTARSWSSVFITLAYLAVLLVVLWIIFSDQISDYVRRTRELEDEAVRVKPFVDIGQNVGGLVHNLRNDIFLINNTLYFLEKGEDGQPDRVNDLRKSIRQLSGRIDRIMFITKDKGEPELLDMNELVRALVELFLCLSDFKRQVKVELDLRDSLYLFADKAELRQVLENLMKNSWEAIASTGRYGTISISTQKRDGAVEVVVADTGGGIPACAQCPERNCLDCGVFKLGRTSKKDGNGYGMVYIKRIVGKFNGSLLVESTVGAGTKISLKMRGLNHETEGGAHR